MKGVEAFIEKAERYHGHICSGQILGIRMALLGLRLLGLNPDDDLRDLVLYLETDRCVADVAYVVTGITVGKRRIKMRDYGKTAMSFLDLGSGKAFRVAVKTSERPPHHSAKEEQMAFWEGYSDDDIFSWREVTIDVPETDLSGPPARVVTCRSCGEDILDGREVIKNGQIHCRGCAEGSYYKPAVK